MPRVLVVGAQSKSLARYLLISFSIALILSSCGANPSSSTSSNPPANNETLTQISTYAALQAGGFDGDTNFAALAQYGDFGLGTFDNLHGEMIALDGVFYQGLPDGTLKQVDPALETPFADVHFFESDQQVKLNQPIQNFDELTAYLAQQLPTQNRPYAFRIHATFPSITIRSVPAQQVPYPTLQEAIASQVLFDKENLSGTLVGYWLPEYVSSFALPGFHFHFISDDKQYGGHMLKLTLQEATIDIDYLENVTLVIPQNDSFQQASFAK